MYRKIELRYIVWKSESFDISKCRAPTYHVDFIDTLDIDTYWYMASKVSIYRYLKLVYSSGVPDLKRNIALIPV